MPQGEITFTVRALISDTWNFLSDMEKVASCTPNVERVRALDDGKSEWTLKVKVGPISRKIVLVNETLSSTPPTHAEFKGEGDNVSMRGQIDLREISSHSTEVRYRIDAEASSGLKAILENVIQSRLPTEMEEFKKNVTQKLESKK